MTDLDELLQRDGRRWQAGFRSPELAGMLAAATRPPTKRARWAWPILAAVLLLAVPLITLQLRQTPKAVVDRPGTSAPGLKLLGTVPWVDVVSQTDGHSVSVYVDIDKTPGMGCITEVPVLQASTTETGTRITIRVQAYQPADYQTPTAAPGTMLACNLMAHFPVPLLVNLRGPIGGRSLIDASTGKTHPAKQAANLPSLVKLPPGYLDAGSSTAQTAGTEQATSMPPGAVGHTYRNGSKLLTLTRVRAGARPRYALTQVEATGTILGHPARIGGPGANDYRCAEWSDPRYTWQLCSIRLGTDALTPLSAAELLTIANNIR